MPDHKAELELRVAEFRRCLGPMERRAHEVAHGPCFLVFENRRPGEEEPGQPWWEEREPTLEAVASLFGERGVVGGSGPKEPRSPNSPEFVGG